MKEELLLLLLYGAKKLGQLDLGRIYGSFIRPSASYSAIPHQQLLEIFTGSCSGEMSGSAKSDGTANLQLCE